MGWLAASENLSKADILRWLDLKNGAVQRALERLCDEDILARLPRDSYEYTQARRERRLKQLEPGGGWGGKPPTLYGMGVRWAAYESDFSRIAGAFGLGSLADGEAVNPRRPSARAHRLSIRCVFAKLEEWPRSSQRGYVVDESAPEIWRIRPEGKLTNGLNGLTQITDTIEAEGIEWRIQFNLSNKGMRTSSVVIRSAKKTGFVVPCDLNMEEATEWLWSRLLGAVNFARRHYSLSLAVKTTRDELRRQVEVARHLGDPLVENILDRAMKGSQGVVLLEGEGSEAVWLDKSEGVWEVETSLENAHALDSLRSSIIKRITGGGLDDASLEILFEEFKSLHRRHDETQAQLATLIQSLELKA